MKTYTSEYLNSLGLSVEILSVTPNPQSLVYAAAIQDYSEENPWKLMYEPQYQLYAKPETEIRDPMNPGKLLTEAEAGRRVIAHCLKFKHWGPLEHPQMVVNVIGFNHTVMQQYRTHRTGISFDVQSGRYTGSRVVKVAEGKLTPAEVFFIRPPGVYQDKGVVFQWTEESFREAESEAFDQSVKYANAVVNRDMPKEMARDLYITYSIRQHFVLSFNLRTGFHLGDMRGKGDAELEAQWLAQLLIDKMLIWAPELTKFYVDTRLGKNLISP